MHRGGMLGPGYFCTVRILRAANFSIHSNPIHIGVALAHSNRPPEPGSAGSQRGYLRATLSLPHRKSSEPS